MLSFQISIFFEPNFHHVAQLFFRPLSAAAWSMAFDNLSVAFNEIVTDLVSTFGKTGFLDIFVYRDIDKIFTCRYIYTMLLKVSRAQHGEPTLMQKKIISAVSTAKSIPALPELTQRPSMTVKALARLEAAAQACTRQSKRELQLVSTQAGGFSALIKHGKTVVEIQGDSFAVRQMD